VLRFSAGARSIDVADWPPDWAEQSDEELISLLQHAAPRHVLGEADTRRRRAGDSSA
jgi:hypothetical protein